MKTKRVGLWAILSLCVSMPLLADSGPSTNGSFEFAAASGPLNFEFDARLQNNGSTQGQITVTGSVDLPDQDVDGEGSGSGAGVVALSMTITVDCLVVNGNHAALSGEVTESNVGGYVGRRAIMAVEDNGEGKNADPDRFTWGFYGSPALTWVATDAELEFDEGVGLTWLATDFEREDDEGIPSHSSGVVDCNTFPSSAYAFEVVPHGAGNIQVKP
jgi:hypothetical protein